MGAQAIRLRMHWAVGWLTSHETWLLLPSPRYSRRMRELLPTAQWVELRGLGHVPMSDDPGLVARTISEFAARVQERTPAVSA